MHCLRLLLVAFLPAAAAVAGPPEWEKSVRAAAAHPRASMNLSAALNTAGQFVFAGEEPAAPAADGPKLADLLGAWRETPADFPKLEPLMAGLTEDRRTASAAEYAAKGAALGPAYLRDHPDDTAAMTFLAFLLERLARPDDAEAWRTRAVAAAPKNPALWRELATHHYRCAVRVAAAEKSPAPGGLTRAFSADSSGDPGVWRQYLLWADANDKPEAARRLAKAGDCYDWAVLLAPHDPMAYAFRSIWQTSLAAMAAGADAGERRAFAALLGRHGVMRENTTVADAVTAAELSPDPRAAGYAFFAAAADNLAADPEGPPLEIQAAFHKPFRRLLPKLERQQQSPDGATAKNAARMEVLLLAGLGDTAVAEKCLLAMPADRGDDVYDSLAMLVYAVRRDDDAGMATLMERQLAGRPDANRSVHLARALVLQKKFTAAATHLRGAVKAAPADPRLALALAAVLVGEGTAADMAEAGRMLSAAEAVYDKKLAAVAAAAPWDEQAAGIPPMKDRAPLCGEFLSADDQERLRHTRVNRVLWLGLAGRLDDATTAVRRWGCADRPADQPVMDALHLIKPDVAVAPAGDVLSPPAFPLGFGRGR